MAKDKKLPETLKAIPEPEVVSPEPEVKAVPKTPGMAKDERILLSNLQELLRTGKPCNFGNEAYQQKIPHERQNEIIDEWLQKRWYNYAGNRFAGMLTEEGMNA